MFGIGFTEVIIIAILALLVLGPERLPELARKLGETVRDMRRIYSNLRAELGPDFDEIEQGIRDLRSLDPRQQLRDYGRGLLDDVTTDAPELKQLAGAPKLDVESLGRKVLRDELLDKPLAERAAAKAAPLTTQPAGAETELLESLVMANDAAPSTRPGSQNGKHPTPAGGSQNGAVAHGAGVAGPPRRARTYSQPDVPAEATRQLPSPGAPVRRARTYNQPAGPAYASEQAPASDVPIRRARTYTQPSSPVEVSEHEQPA